MSKRQSTPQLSDAQVWHCTSWDEQLASKAQVLSLDKSISLFAGDGFSAALTRFLLPTLIRPLVDGLGNIELQSPIEEMFFVALCLAADRHDCSFDIQQVDRESGRVRYLYGPEWSSTRTVTISPQHPVGSYRVDFMLSMLDDCAKDSGRTGQSQLIAECDGHDFHERTKAQAAHDKRRDRALQELGYTIFHFTGSEIWSDPIGCADQCIESLIKRAAQ